MQLEKLERNFSSLKDNLGLSRVPGDPLDVSLCAWDFSKFRVDGYFSISILMGLRTLNVKL
jgi:hypothetical protein